MTRLFTMNHNQFKKSQEKYRTSVHSASYASLRTVVPYVSKLPIWPFPHPTHDFLLHRSSPGPLPGWSSHAHVYIDYYSSSFFESSDLLDHGCKKNTPVSFTAFLSPLPGWQPRVPPEEERGERALRPQPHLRQGQEGGGQGRARNGWVWRTLLMAVRFFDALLNVASGNL